MARPTLFNLIKDLVAKSKKKNQEDPQVDTAPPQVFENIQKKVEEVENCQDDVKSNDDLMEMLKKKLGEVKTENEANPDEPTADKSVFDNILSKLDMTRNQTTTGGLDIKQPKDEGPQVIFEEVKPPVSKVSEIKIPEIKVPKVKMPKFRKPPAQEAPAFEMPPPAESMETYIDDSTGTMAMTNSMGGSLGMRTAPDFGAPEIKYRIPDSSLVRVIEYSDKTINLDGVNARWVKVAFEGHVGWTLETYLNFN